MKTVAIYPGRFQPPHIGHLKAWHWLNFKYDHAYIATSNIVDPDRSPFDFIEKRQLFLHAGVPDNAIIQVKNPYNPIEIVGKYDQEETILIFTISQKDMNDDPRMTFKTKKDGSDSYLQKLTANPEPASKHGYVTVVPTFGFNINGSKMHSASEFRANFAQADDHTQKKMVADMYGTYNDDIHELLKTKIG